MKTIEVYGSTWQKFDVEPYRFIDALINDFLGYYTHWVKEENGSYYIMSEDSHGFEETVRCISKEEKEYYEAMKVVQKFLNKQHDAELKKERENK